jgi:hypothetical protein
MAAVRYTFGYRGDEVWLVGRHRVQTVAPVSAPLVDLAGRSGFWCELRDDAGRAMHRQVLRDPRHPTDEIHAPQPAHVPRPEPAGVFTVLVPEPAAGEQTMLALIQRRATDAAPHDVLTVPQTTEQ